VFLSLFFSLLWPGVFVRLRWLEGTKQDEDGFREKVVVDRGVAAPTPWEAVVF